MCRRFLRSVFSLWLLTLAFTAASSVQGDPLLWRVSKTASGAGVYLFGSIHFGHDGMYPLSDKVIESFADTDTLVVEVDLLASNPEHMSILLSERGHNPEGVLLSSLLSQDDWLRFKAICQRQGVSAERFQHMQPWLAAIQLSAIQMRASGYTEDFGVDRYFLRMAKTPGLRKSVLELESLESQLGIFSELSMQEQISFLRQSLDEYEVGGDYLQLVAEAWEAGDERELHNLIIGAFDNTDVAKAMYQVIFTERNQRMVDAVAQLLDTDQRAFVVVGVGHMIGDDGLVALLKSRGLHVEGLSSLP